METALSRHMAGDPGASSQGGLGSACRMDRVWQTLAVTVINAHEDVLVMWLLLYRGHPVGFCDGAIDFFSHTVPRAGRSCRCWPVLRRATQRT